MTDGKHHALRLKLRDAIAGAKGTKLFVRTYDLTTLLDYISKLEADVYMAWETAMGEDDDAKT